MEELTWADKKSERERKDKTRALRGGVVHMQVASKREEERAESGCETGGRSYNDGKEDERG